MAGTHALLSPSAAYRWLNCPLAPRLEATLPERDSTYAAEGTLAHKVCEITAKKKFKKVKAAEYNKVMKGLKASELWNDEMLRTAETYVEHLSERAMSFKNEPYIAFETKVDISDYVPEAFGQCDCIMFSGDTLIITDYKHGMGVPVKAVENPQLMLYALGALKLYWPLFGNAIRNIEIYIDQPRLDSYNNWFTSCEDLLKWGEGIKPKAQKAFMGFGEYHAGDWCQFCRANGTCKAQADQMISALDDFGAIAGENPATLNPEQMGAALTKGKGLVEWYEKLKEKALELVLAGTKIPDWKAVEGRSIRFWNNQDAALAKLEASGIEHAVLYDSVPKSLAKIEKMLGAESFNNLVGEYVVKPQGKPTLAPMTDKRPDFNGAVADFAGLEGDVPF